MHTDTPAQPAKQVDVSSTAATTSGHYRVIRRNGKVTAYDREKIAIAITKAFLAIEGGNAAASSRIHEIANKIAEEVEFDLTRCIPDGGTFHIEDISDHIELALMRCGHHQIARSYVIYREEQAGSTTPSSCSILDPDCEACQ